MASTTRSAFTARSTIETFSTLTTFPFHPLHSSALVNTPNSTFCALTARAISAADSAFAAPGTVASPCCCVAITSQHLSQSPLPYPDSELFQITNVVFPSPNNYTHTLPQCRKSTRGLLPPEVEARIAEAEVDLEGVALAAAAESPPMAPLQKLHSSRSRLMIKASSAR